MPGEVPVFRPGEIFLTMAEGIPRMWGVADSGATVLLSIHTEDPQE